MTDFSEKKEKIEQLFNMIKETRTTDELSQESHDILFILSQNYILEIKGKGMSKQELINIIDITSYVVHKLFDELNRKNLIKFLKKRSIDWDYSLTDQQ